MSDPNAIRARLEHLKLQRQAEEEVKRREEAERARQAKREEERLERELSAALQEERERRRFEESLAKRRRLLEDEVRAEASAARRLQSAGPGKCVRKKKGIRKTNREEKTDTAMEVDTAEVPEAKGKQKEEGRTESEGDWRFFYGEERCSLCLRDEAECLVNMAAIDRWQRDADEGKVFARAPTGISCGRCGAKRKKCELPATAELRGRLVPRAVDTTTSASEAPRTIRVSGRKRKETPVEVEEVLPPVKRVKKVSAPQADVQLQTEMLSAMRAIRGELGRLVAQSSAAAAEAKAQGRLLTAILDRMVPKPATPRAETDSDSEEENTPKRGKESAKAAVEVVLAADTPKTAEVADDEGESEEEEEHKGDGEDDEEDGEESEEEEK
jgi:hypothetical protein